MLVSSHYHHDSVVSTDLSGWMGLQMYLSSLMTQFVSSSPDVTLSFSCVANIAAAQYAIRHSSFHC